MIPLDLTKKIAAAAAEEAVREALRPVVTVAEEWEVDDDFIDVIGTTLLVAIEIPAARVRHELRLDDVHRYSFEAWARVLAGEPSRPGSRTPLLCRKNSVIQFDLDWNGDRYIDQLERSVSLSFPREALEAPILAALERLRASGVVFKADA